MISLSHMWVFCTVVSKTSSPVVLIPHSFCTSPNFRIAEVPWCGDPLSYQGRARSMPAGEEHAGTPWSPFNLGHQERRWDTLSCETTACPHIHARRCGLRLPPSSTPTVFPPLL